MAFGILICCFMQRPLYLLWCTPPSSTFIKYLISFDTSFHKVFKCFWSIRSFDNLERPLVHKQASFLITFSGIKLILTSAITPIAYLGNLALVVSIITNRFMVNQHPFIFEALACVMTLTLGSWPRQGHGRCGSIMQLRSHIHIPKNARECEGMNPHTPKWTFTLGVRIWMDSQIFKKWFERSKFIGLNSFLYHWKYLKM